MAVKAWGVATATVLSCAATLVPASLAAQPTFVREDVDVTFPDGSLSLS